MIRTVFAVIEISARSPQTSPAPTAGPFIVHLGVGRVQTARIVRDGALADGAAGAWHLLVRINRPEARNALNLATRKALATLFEAFHWNAVARTPQPVIAAIDGYALRVIWLQET